MNRPIYAVFLSCAIGLFGCEPPNTDPGGDPPGSIPEISGQIEGTVLYVGQRPECQYDGETATAVRGRVILLLFNADNPPPPAGTATTAENLLVVPGSELFGLSDCLPAAPSPEELASVITRSVAFSWPEIALAEGEGATRAYQMRGFYDRDADFNPFFSVRKLPTRGDVAGGAFVNTAAVPPQFARIRFGSVEDEPDGQVVDGVAVTLGAIVNTELPVAELGDGTHALSSEATVPATTDQLMLEQQLWEQTSMTLSLIDPTRQDWAATLAAAGMSVDPSPSGFGWFILPVDANGDGMGDDHPILSRPDARVPWQHPIVILRRARNPLEIRAGIPDVVFVATVRPSQTISKRTFDPTIQIAVPPVAAVTLDPTNPACQIPYIAPGNQASLYERIPVDCQEMPTGNYDVNVLTGIAGGRAINYREQTDAAMPGLPPAVLDSIVRGKTDNDWIIDGGQYSSQAWSIPNELGCPDPIYRPTGRDEAGNPIAVSQIDPDPATTCADEGTVMQVSQGPAGRFAVVDPSPANAPRYDDNTVGHGIASCATAPDGATPRPVEYMEVPAECCDAIRHLCNIPLCEPANDAVLASSDGGHAIREVRALNEDGTPTCVPFLMPASCCR